MAAGRLLVRSGAEGPSSAAELEWLPVLWIRQTFIFPPGHLSIVYPKSGLRITGAIANIGDGETSQTALFPDKSPERYGASPSGFGSARNR